MEKLVWFIDSVWLSHNRFSSKVDRRKGIRRIWVKQKESCQAAKMKKELCVFICLVSHRFSIAIRDLVSHAPTRRRLKREVMRRTWLNFYIIFQPMMEKRAWFMDFISFPIPTYFHEKKTVGRELGDMDEAEGDVIRSWQAAKIKHSCALLSLSFPSEFPIGFPYQDILSCAMNRPHKERQRDKEGWHCLEHV